MQTRNCGYTLVDLVAVLAVIAIVTGLSIPSLHAMVERNQAAMGINWITRAVNLTRVTAIERGVLTTLCPTRDRKMCGGAWNDEVMIFTDANNDRQVNGEDVVILVLDYPYKNSTLKWRSFRNRQYLQMTSMGFTHFQNGNFVYCSKDQDPRFSRQVVLNLQGRLRRSYDRDNDGLIEDSYGDDLRC